MNYRRSSSSARAREVTDPDENAPGDAIASSITLFRELGGCAPAERRGDQRHDILALPLDEASAKIRSGPPTDDEADKASRSGRSDPRSGSSLRSVPDSGRRRPAAGLRSHYNRLNLGWRSLR